MARYEHLPLDKTALPRYGCLSLLPSLRLRLLGIGG